MFNTYRSSGVPAPGEHLAPETAGQDYYVVFDAIPAPLLIVECDSLQIATVNAAAMRGLGFSKGELRALSLLDLLDEADRAAVQKAHGRLEAHSTWDLARRDGKKLRATAVGGLPVRFQGRACLLLYGTPTGPSTPAGATTA